MGACLSVPPRTNSGYYNSYGANDWGGQNGGGGGRPGAAESQNVTATVRNQVNLKKPTLALEPLPGRPHDFGLKFTFDATAPCRVTTFLLATEDPGNGCSVTSAVLGAPARTPVHYDKGMGLKFPPPGDDDAAEAHVISSLRAPMGHMVLAAGNSYPLIIRLESLTDAGRAEGRTLEELEVGGSFAPHVQAQTTYAKLRQDDDGTWEIQVLKQKIFVQGVSYELQEIYGLENAAKRTKRQQSSSAAAAAGDGGASASDPLATASYDENEGGECVICMSADRDTMVLPCRHMCMCQECASALKHQSSKCPICRNEISSLLHIKMRRRSSIKRHGGAAIAAVSQTR